MELQPLRSSQSPDAMGTWTKRRPRRSWLLCTQSLAAAASLAGTDASEILKAIGGHADTSVADLEVRLGECSIPVPHAFSCRTIPHWGRFLKTMQEEERAGFPVSLDLFDQAETILQAFHEKPYPPQDFYKYICGGSAETWPLDDGFCLYGFVAALFVRSRHLMLSSDEATRQSANTDFGYAATVLGKEGSVDFLDSSPWPVSIIDVYLNINQTDFLTYKEYKRRNPVRRPVVPLASLKWRPPREHDLLRRRSVPETAMVAVFGTHATLSLEPVEMLRRYVHGVPSQVVFYGLEPRWCQILGVCNQGSAVVGQLFKAAEADPYAYPWEVLSQRLSEIYDGDAKLRASNLLLCTEPLAGCLILREVAAARGQRLPILGYFGVALLNGCPPEDIDTFWWHFANLDARRDEAGRLPAVLSVNNMMLSEQIFYQSGRRLPYVRAHGLYTSMSYTPLKTSEILVWRAPLFTYSTILCAMNRFLAGMPEYPMSFRFVGESESLSYPEISSYQAVTLFPWDHALMTFYELYSAGIPLLMPGSDWMYRFLYQRGQLSVGEPLYQSIMPGHEPPDVEFAEEESFKEKAGPPSQQTGMSSAKAARGVCEDMLTRGLQSTDLASAHQYMKAALELMQDMRYFLAVAENKTHEDSSTSMGVVRRKSANGPKPSPPPPPRAPPSLPVRVSAAEVPPEGATATQKRWHPYTPFQMSPRDSNDWTRMRKGGWWLRRGTRFDAMRYWYQYSDFANFPGINYFGSIPSLFCLAQTLDVAVATETMRRFNERTLVDSASFWVYSIVELLGSDSSVVS
eukprot:TRINITY_DN48961_c0_g1_i1.p1 TRINITY_DN48961_c0_g1~~TRINITY_DN48961_c0_g1_i1.p1  ORF type:complete len:799 (+),score=82.67 TRINITY_DN48961_c0_g1_i1:79-2475(+)